MLLFSHRSLADLAAQASRLQWCYLSDRVVSLRRVDAENLVSLVEQHPSWFETPDRVALMTGEDIVHSMSAYLGGQSRVSVRPCLRH